MKTILITRPQHQAHALTESLKTQGWHVLHWPVLKILPLNAEATWQALPNTAKHPNAVIFTSANAVRHAKPFLTHFKKSKCTIIAIGPATKAALTAQSIQHVISPTTHFNSEAVLALPELQNVTAKNLLLIKGEGGRQLLADTLKKRGATLNELNVYRREKNETPPPESLQQITHTVTTSTATLNALNDLIQTHHQHHLYQLPLITVSPQGTQAAQTHGFVHILQAKSPTDHAILNTLKEAPSS